MISFNKVNTTRVSSLVSDECIKMFLSLQLVISGFKTQKELNRGPVTYLNKYV